MDNLTLLISIIVVLAIGVLLVGAVLGWVFARRQRTKHLRRQFGPEYDRVVREAGDRDEAEAELEARQERIKSLDIHPLSPDERDHYVEAWQSIQVRFVDQPAEAVEEANQLVTEVMQTRGYPMVDFDQRMADLSVEHAEVIKNYRAARAIAQKNKQGEASTEELRQAMVHYRGLFAELVGAPDIQKKEAVAA